MSKIFLISGKARHGKDTISSMLKEIAENNNKKVIITQLSKYLKYYAKEIVGWDFNEETKPRQFLQDLGNKVRIDMGKYDFFTDRMIEDIEIFNNYFDIIIISDVRLKNEINKIKSAYANAISINVFRPNFDNGMTEEQKNHLTEIDLDDFKNHDYIVENTTLENLREKANEIYEKERE